MAGDKRPPEDPAPIEAAPAPGRGEDRHLQQAAGRAAALVTNFLIEFDAQPFADAIGQRLGLVVESGPTAILFSELAGFSSWVLTAGDDRALELLRKLGAAAEPPITEHRGRLVKRLGSGHMAVFNRPGDGVLAALDMQRAVDLITVDGYRPELKIGLHLGTPQRVDGDYLGTDVNIAARLAEGANPRTLLASGQVVDALDERSREKLSLHQLHTFRAKGAPADLRVYVVDRAPRPT